MYISFLFTTIGLVVPKYVFGISKCCPQGEKVDFSEFNCVPVSQTDKIQQTLNFPKFSEVRLPSCDSIWMDDVEINQINSENYFSLSSNGNLVQIVQNSPYREFPETSYCLESENGNLIAVICPCENYNCINKCCGDGSIVSLKDQSCIDLPNITREEINNIIEEFNNSNFYVLKNQLEYEFCSGILRTASQFGATFEITVDGEAKVFEDVYTYKTYCLDISLASDGRAIKDILICSGEFTEGNVQNIVYAIILYVGSFFLALSFMIYVLLPELRRNIHGKNFMCHSGSLFVAFLAAAINRSFQDASRDECRVMGE